MKPVATILITLALCACGKGVHTDSGGEPVYLAELEHLLDGGPVVRIGSVEEGAAAFRMMMGARLDPSATMLFVLDRDPPFLRVFRTDGQEVGSFVGRGDGPTESRGPLALGVSDSVLVLAEPGRLLVVSTATYAARRVPGIGVGAQDVDFGCNGQWIAYGPSMAKPRHYLHRLAVDSTVRLMQSALVDSAPIRRAWGSSTPQVTAANGRLLVLHRTAQKSEFKTTSCSGEPVEAPWDWAVGKLPSQTAGPNVIATAKSGSGEAVRIDATIPVYAGSTVVGDSLLWLETRVYPMRRRPRSLDDLEDRTYFYLLGSRGSRSGYVRGSYWLRDARAGMAVLSHETDIPRLLIVKLADIHAALGQGHWVARP